MGELTIGIGFRWRNNYARHRAIFFIQSESAEATLDYNKTYNLFIEAAAETQLIYVA